MNTPGRSAGAWKWRLDRMPGKDLGRRLRAATEAADRRLDSGGRMAAPAAPDQILDVNRRYHDVAADDYDAKWGISFGEIGRQQVLGKVTQAARRRSPGPFARSLEIGAGTGYFTLNLLQDRRDRARRPARTSRPGMLATLEHNAARARPRRRDRRVRRRRAAVRGRELRPRARPRRAAPPARPRPRVRRVLPRADAGRDAVLRRRAVAARRPDRRRAQARGGAALAPLWRRAVKRARPRAAGTTAATRTTTRSRPIVDVHAFVPADLERTPRGAGLRGRPRARRGAAGELVRLVQPHARGDAPSPRTSRGAGSSTPTAATSLLQAVDRRAARAAPAAAALLQPDARGAQAARLMAEPERPTLPARSTCCATRGRWSTPASAPVAFVIVYALAELDTAAIVAVAISASSSLYRAPVRRKPAHQRDRRRCSAPACACSSRCAPAARRATSCRGRCYQPALALVFAGSVRPQAPTGRPHRRAALPHPPPGWRPGPARAAGVRPRRRWPGRRCSACAPPSTRC